MSKTFKDSPKHKQQRTGRNGGRQRNISVRAVRRDPPDLRKLARALIDLAIAQSEADAAATTTTPNDTAAGDEAAHD